MANEFEWRQFERLGEMIGDGLHHEEKWITKEYNRLMKILLPKTDFEKKLSTERRKKRVQRINELLVKPMERDRCSCGGKLKQSRSGSLVVKCVDCPKKYRYKLK